MNKREFITLLGCSAAWPLAARAQQTGMRRVGIVMPYPKGDTEYEIRVRALRQELGKAGMDRRRQRSVRRALDHRQYGSGASHCGKPDGLDPGRGRRQWRPGHSPIDAALSHDPDRDPGSERSGRRRLCAKPGSARRQCDRIYVFRAFDIRQDARDVETDRACHSSRCVRLQPGQSHHRLLPAGLRGRRGPLAIEPIIVPIHGLDDIDRAAAGLAQRRNAGAFVPPDLTLQALRAEVVALVARHRLPTIYSDPAFPKIGGLAFYGPDRVDLYRSAAGYVDRILRGEKPGDLPFQQPTKYQLILNLKTAKALGLKISDNLLSLADEVIE